jgi:hypothetical protein
LQKPLTNNLLKQFHLPKGVIGEKTRASCHCHIPKLKDLPTITIVTDAWPANVIYNLAYAKKSKSECTTTDAERLKRNMTYALHQYKSEDYDTFKRMV